MPSSSRPSALTAEFLRSRSNCSATAEPPRSTPTRYYTVFFHTPSFFFQVMVCSTLAPATILFLTKFDLVRPPHQRDDHCASKEMTCRWIRQGWCDKNAFDRGGLVGVGCWVVVFLGVGSAVGSAVG